MSLPLRTADECSVHFETGMPVTFGFVRNTEKASNFGSRFQQDIEPAGRYMQHDCGFSERLSSGWIRGTQTFRSPLVLSFSEPKDELEPLYGPHSWKAELHRHFKAKGKSLSRKILRAGFDGIVTVWSDRTTREIVALPAGWGWDAVLRAL